MVKFNYEMNINRIKETRINKGISQKKLAKNLNLQTSNLSKYENLLENIPINRFNDICNYLEISFDFALDLNPINNFNIPTTLNSRIIGERLKSIRKDNNLYQETLANEIGTSKSLICEYEKGVKLLSLPYAYAICKKYNISMDWLYGKIDEPKNIKVPKNTQKLYS